MILMLLGVALLLLGLGAAIVATRRSKGDGSSAALGAITLACIAGFGILLPAGVIAHNADEQSRQATRGLVLTAAEQDGRKVFARNCATCHSLAAANAVGRVGPNLDDRLGEIPRNVRRILVYDAVQNGRAQGNGQMPAGLVTGDDLAHVAAFLTKAAGR